MKLATWHTGSRDGALIVVSRDLTRATHVASIAPTLQHALDHWDTCAPQLTRVYDDLNHHRIAASFAFDAAQVMAPLPRAYQWADASVYVNHVELVRKSRGVSMPENFWTDPLIYQGGSDHFLGPCDNIECADLTWGIDFEAEVAVITTDVPMGISATTAISTIALIVLVNDISLRYLALPELSKGFGFFQCKPASSMSPVALTLDEFGTHWREGKLHLPIISHLRGQVFGHPNTGMGMAFDFPSIIAHAAKTRHLGSGTVIGSGAVSNRDDDYGSSCIVEKRTLESLTTGKAKTPFMQYGDTVRIEMLDEHQQSLFGAIEQTVVPYFPPS